ncbi:MULTISPECIES: ABC transporter ATP-binding protein [Pseudonocardia]|uniref:Bicarbonate transport ATP-binding protein CmpD n=2 Tax=Pseudonocardia TaxID=1847 RepID=A0A1Y2MYY6_PSEAH|nr:MULTISPECIES: ABC transporter ATP-binding protein [Pseudonocardia]OSY40390.1 Bicarbonate transport ATP-binding protein CmpD [Pseudonocardia autotrophica]TDN72279.1 NitT/TauT family transport system ATP-binding protein [Pseudonocardia autotrophica]BBG02991.1 ABC transporter ATP-binding protein [Pseudonocardia autotrophica]GEC25107.1 ABC transporter ATP-binding protein [Pseudonocardia saturnea]
MAEPVMTFSHVTKHYGPAGGGTRAVDDLDLEIADGEFVSIVGPSGCGKSTLLKLVMGLEPLTGGSIEYRAEATSIQAMTGMVFQQPLLLPWHTVLDNVLVPSALQGRARKRADTGHARTLLGMLGLTDFADRYPYQLSGGMQQRVGIARALLHDPRILLMDEPFGALDAMTRDQLTMDLLDLWERDRKTVLFITHSISEAVLLSDRVVVMTPRPGRIAEIVDIDVRRPRTLDMVNTPEFGRIAGHIRQLLDDTERVPA